MKTFALTLLAAAAFSTPAQALTVVETNNGSTLVNSLLAGASGITVDPASINLIGVPSQSGTFSGFVYAGNGTAAAPALSLGNGIVMTTGDATVPTTNTQSSYSAQTGTGASTTITGITSLNSNDQNRLALNFTAAAGVTSIALNFIYASEEFPEYAATEYADGFAFVVDGVNYAKFADGSTVSLLTLGSNANLFNNASSVYGIEYDGLTPSLTVTGLLDATRTTHTLEIVIADTGDDIYDSAVFLSSLQGSSASTGGGITPTLPGGGNGGGITPAIPEPQTYALMLAGLAALGVAVRRRSRQG